MPAAEAIIGGVDSAPAAKEAQRPTVLPKPMSDLERLAARLQSLDPAADPDAARACMREAADVLANLRGGVTVGAWSRDGRPETLALEGVWYDRRETVDALATLLAEARLQADA